MEKELTIDQKIEAKKKELQELENVKAEEEAKNNPLLINDLKVICDKLGHDMNKDIVSFDGFTDSEMELIKNVAARIRICKVYNKGILPKSDERWYPWWRRNSLSASGLEFRDSCFDVVGASLASAARLAFASEKGASAFARNFPQIDAGIIQIKDCK